MQATLVASRKSLHKRKGVLEVTHELLERLEAHLRATAELMVSLHITHVCDYTGWNRVIVLPIFILGHRKHEGKQRRRSGRESS